MRARRIRVLTPAEEAFYAGFTPMKAATGSPGRSSHAGREGKIVQVILLLGKSAVEVRFDDGDGCFLTCPVKHRMELIRDTVKKGRERFLACPEKR